MRTKRVTNPTTKDLIKEANKALDYVPFHLLLRRIERDLNDVSGICAAAIRKRIELEAEVEKLREGIKKHMNNTNRDYNYLDEELYKLVEKT